MAMAYMSQAAMTVYADETDTGTQVEETVDSTTQESAEDNTESQQTET